MSYELAIEQIRQRMSELRGEADVAMTNGQEGDVTVLTYAADTLNLLANQMEENLRVHRGTTL